MPTKEKKKTSKKTERVILSLLIDESGSMAGNEASVRESFNSFVSEIAASDEAKGKDVRTTLGMFDRHGNEPIVRVKFDAVKVSEAPQLAEGQYQPRGTTPLNDAVMETIRQVEKADGDRALVVIITDGYENASETKTETVREAITEKEKLGWRFIYLGANQDAWAEGQQRGVAAASSMNYSSTPSGTKAAMKATANRGMAYIGDSGKYPEQYDALAKQEFAATGGTIADPGETGEKKDEKKGSSSAEALRYLSD